MEKIRQSQKKFSNLETNIKCYRSLALNCLWTSTFTKTCLPQLKVIMLNTTSWNNYSKCKWVRVQRPGSLAKGQKTNPVLLTSVNHFTIHIVQYWHCFYRLGLWMQSLDSIIDSQEDHLQTDSNIIPRETHPTVREVTLAARKLN